MFEYENMVEEMVTEIEQKEKDNEELKKRVEELEESYFAADELNTETETYNTQLEKKIEEKDLEIQKLNKEMEKLEDMCLEEAADKDKYKARLNEINDIEEKISEHKSNIITYSSKIIASQNYIQKLPLAVMWKKKKI